MSKILAIIISIFLILSPSANAETDKIQTATFAGGCFWCMEPPYDKVEGVISTTSGYTGGNVKNPTYKQVSQGQTGHAEAVQVKYDSSKINYEYLLDIFWKNIDPTVKNRQFCDVGNQYRSGIFYHSEEQKQLALASREKVEKQLNGKIYTEITPVKDFYPAEEYHQDYYKKNPLLYKYYRFRCGRDQRLKELWGS
ncbi:peptide-methionine (S)-S-oxide reductase MsrA [Cyanobacterium aponinum UTEX 3222]|uniref:peptide-methionine (S)-S-oxide reductase MsrA n=1 Tax=Cyanobacterium aponinum TaxID=379064 RepID=UPI00168108A9|nr:peptide-methionine (S)-S-oxide reductase MsrA [Cyanobacterium aponinum]MBD2394000.1 peptide-methionine (S)-S-oxide reductase MsrA [Cyanobacterium aponinum FACHB-4101]WRL42681.1 peptide-methionine (S)-S-oxide reductase MsrA [Cyanobacterium aponinum UTEX 3222]